MVTACLMSDKPGFILEWPNLKSENHSIFENVAPNPRTQTMVKQQETSNNESGKLKRFLANLFQWKFWLLVAWLGFIIWLIIYLSRVFTVQTERYTFIAQQLFSGLVFTAVVVQAFIYFGQLRVMGIAVNPRLRISNVETINFVVSRTPIFIVTLVNEGATDAHNVAIFLKAEQVGAGVGTHLIKQQITTIPAHGRQEYFVRWGGPVDATFIDEVERGKKRLEISGSYEYAKSKPVTFCYRYYVWPWPEDRPERLPRFVPCDLNTGQNFFITPQTGHFQLTGNPIAMIHGEVKPIGKVTLEKRTGNAKPERDDKENPN
jgi:hypothetical protein